MSTSVLTNTGAMIALQNLEMTNRSLNQTQSQVSSGLAVSSAADDAATWVVATTMNANIASLKQVSQGLGNADSILGTAVSGATEIASLVAGIRAAVTSTQDPATDCFSLASVVIFVLSGKAPFGEQDGRSILARALARDADLSPYPEEIADWLRRGLSPEVADRFADAGAMQAAWREAVQAVFEREQRAPWWRRWFANDGAGVAWAGESPFTT